jgi:NRAMP (natural resistance-associated macrophage protein)-like metal ion transporter
MAIREEGVPISSAPVLSSARSDVVGPSKPRLWKILGPGLITGASDDDPSGIATYSQAGAQYGFRLGWTLLFTYPLMFVVQAISARIGRTTGRGLAGNLREHYPNVVLQGVVLLLFVANTLNIGADLAAMGEATRLLMPSLPTWVCVVSFGLLCAAGQILLKHTRYVALLKWLSLSLFTYFAVLCVEHIDWGSVATQLVIPQFSSERGFWMMIVAILGTTISPYLFFWQAAQEVEDTKAKPEREPLRRSPSQGPSALSRIRLDTLVGMGFSNLVALAIMVSAGATLHRSGMHEISSAADAAKALEPVAGHFAFALFALGIIGTGLLSVPVLAGSAAYALGEARRWPVGLARRPREAKAFYGAIVLATCLGGAANLAAINAVDALVWAAILNALVAVPVMALLVLMASDRQIMGQFDITSSWKWFGWLATGVMGVASLAFLITLFLKPGG